jgi:pimeloyl-ACP methyl ester carboxylesterase
VFDQFYASQVPSLDNEPSEMLTQAAGGALLDRIGPAILVTHSQAGAFGWLIADARPKLVRAIVALEPMGPPYKDAIFQTGHDRPWGLADVPLTYDPPVTDMSKLSFVQQSNPNSPDLAACWSQTAPARPLPNLGGIPVLLATTQASYHSVYDHCTAAYLKQAGVNVDFERLADHGIEGNGHMMMLEKNNLELPGS